MRSIGDKRLRLFKRWGPLFGVLLVLGLLSVLDGRLKNSPAFGYCPADSVWTVRAPHLVQWWRSFEKTDAGGVLGEELREYLPALALSFRQATGIRPTSVRLKAWLGHQVLLGGGEDRWGMCVRPGILVHTGLWLHGIFSGGVAEGGIAEFHLGENVGGAPSTFYYGWRDGFLIVSPWREYVRASLDAPLRIEIGGRTLNDELTLTWSGAPSGMVSFRAEEGLPCRGRVAMALAAENNIRAIPEGLADGSLLFFSGVDGDALKGLWARFLPWFVAPDLEERAAVMCNFLLERWGGDGAMDGEMPLLEDVMVALVDVDVSGHFPVPAIAVLLPAGRGASGVRAEESVLGMRFDVGEHPLRGLLVAGDTIPYAWNSTEGAIMPLLGEELSPCFARAGGFWLATSQEPVMSSVLQELDSTVPVRWGTSVRMDWEKVATFVDAMGGGGGVMSWVTKGRRLGALRLSAHLEDGATFFQGYAARGAGASS